MFVTLIPFRDYYKEISIYTQVCKSFFRTLGTNEILKFVHIGIEF